jgi:hypothetical protein
MYSEYNPNEFYYVTSIDVGVKNLGISFTEMKKDFTVNQVIWFDCIDITTFVHLDKETKKKCPLYHEKTYCDYLEHVFYLYHELFDASYRILVERQPPQGYVVVEQLIFSKFRDKVKLISPNSMHAYFSWRKFDYEKRKYYSEQQALFLLKDKPRDYLVEEFNCHPRKHDISDSICMVLFWSYKMHENWKVEESKRSFKLNTVAIDDLDKYRYFGHVDKDFN